MPELMTKTNCKKIKKIKIKLKKKKSRNSKKYSSIEFWQDDFSAFFPYFFIFSPSLGALQVTDTLSPTTQKWFFTTQFHFFRLSLNFGSLLVLQKRSFWKSKPRSLTTSTRRTNFSDLNFDNHQIAGRVGKSNFSHSTIVECRCPPLYYNTFRQF